MVTRRQGDGETGRPGDKGMGGQGDPETRRYGDKGTRNKPWTSPCLPLSPSPCHPLALTDGDEAQLLNYPSTGSGQASKVPATALVCC